MPAAKATITGTGYYVPPKKVTNYDLEKMMDTSHDWIIKRSGISQRYHADSHTTTSDLAKEASVIALRRAECSAQQLDLIITATLSPDHHFPGIGVKLQHLLGLETTPAMDIRNQCSGFIYGLATAKAFIESGQYQKILLVGAEIHSKLVNLTTEGRDVAVLFGDGAGAVIIEAEADTTKAGIKSCQLFSQGEFADKLWIERPGTTSSRFFAMSDFEEGRHFPKMDGRYVFKHATRRLEEAVNKVLESTGLQLDQIDHFLFHQANIRINEHVAQSMGIPLEKVHNNIDRFGNCSAASLPILLDECVQNERIKRGDWICFGAFGAGFTWATAIVQW